MRPFQRMGRKRWTNRLTVDDCLSLDVESFRRAGMIPSISRGLSGTLTWTHCSGAFLGRLDYVTVVDWEGTTIRIREQLAKLHSELTEIPEQKIQVTTTEPYLGGERFWFYCACWRQVGKLYLPPGEVVFRCRRCYNLIHKSAQRHDQRVYDLARNPLALDAAFQSEKHNKRLLAVGAVTLQLTWLHKGRLVDQLSK